MKGDVDSPGVSEHERSGWMPTMSISLSSGVLYLQPHFYISQWMRAAS